MSFLSARRLLILTVASVLLSPSAKAAWRAGAGKVDITPSYSVRLSGYGGRTTENEGVKAPIYAKALAMAWDDEAPAVVVTVDNCGVPSTIRDKALAALAEQKITSANFAICSSHTHCAPMLSGMLNNIFGEDLPPDQQQRVERYTQELTENIIKVTHEALAAMKPATLSMAHGEASFAFNRRKPTPTGFTNSQYPEGHTDHDLPVLKVTDSAGVVRAVFTSYACHCTTMGWNFIHPDWAGVAQAALEKAYPQAVALTAIGCGADQNPYPRSEEKYLAIHGQELADAAAKVVNGPQRALNGPFKGQVQTISLAFDSVPGNEHWQELAANGKSKHEKHLGTLFMRMLERKEAVPTELPYLVQTWTFGHDLAMVFLNGEMVVDYSLRLKHEYDKDRMWVNGYSSNVPCYIPSERVLKEGGYEGGGAMVYYARPNKFAPGLEDKIIGAVHAMVPESFRAK